MNNPRTKLLLIIGGSLLFHQLFWNQTAGLNVLLWTLLSLVAIGLKNPTVFRWPRALLVLGASLLCSAMVVTHHSLFALLLLVFSLAAAMGFGFQPSHKSALAAGLTAIAEALKLPSRIVSLAPNKPETQANLRKWLWAMRLWAVPVAAVAAFYMLYRSGNAVFDSLNNRAFASIGQVFARIFCEISLPWVAFMLVGLSLSALVLAKPTVGALQRLDAGISEMLLRNRKWRDPMRQGRLKVSPVALRSELRSVTYFLLLANVLLLVVNSLDVTYVWLFFDSAGHNLSQFVHEGTYTLIVSILLAMALLVFVFRGNLNFLRTNSRLRVLAYVWLGQNALLALSVAMRNTWYFTEMGLSYRRIGVFVFLLLVLIGLATLAYKISQKRTLWWLLNVNSLAVMGVLSAFVCVDWDVAIARYNLTQQQPHEVDVHYLLSLSNSALPVIAEHWHRLDRNGIDTQKPAGEAFAKHIASFYQRTNALDWPSWTWADHRTKQKLTALGYTQAWAKNHHPELWS